MGKYVVINGELYHADRKDHKYIDKVKTKTGKWRYIYKNATNKVKDALGYDEKDRKESYADLSKAAKENAYDYYKSAFYKETAKDYDPKLQESKNRKAEEYDKLAKKADKDYYKTPLGKMEKAKEAVAEAPKKIADKVEDKVFDVTWEIEDRVSDTVNTVKDKIGYDERDEYWRAKRYHDNLQSQVDEASEDADYYFNRAIYFKELGYNDLAEKELEKSRKANKLAGDISWRSLDEYFMMKEAKARFDKTPLGKLHAADNKVQGTIDAGKQLIEEFLREKRR